MAVLALTTLIFILDQLFQHVGDGSPVLGCQIQQRALDKGGNTHRQGGGFSGHDGPPEGSGRDSG